jgi:hypothetical protein
MFAGISWVLLIELPHMSEFEVLSFVVYINRPEHWLEFTTWNADANNEVNQNRNVFREQIHKRVDGLFAEFKSVNKPDTFQKERKSRLKQ